MCQINGNQFMGSGATLQTSTTKAKGGQPHQTPRNGLFEAVLHLIQSLVSAQTVGPSIVHSESSPLRMTHLQRKCQEPLHATRAVAADRETVVCTPSGHAHFQRTGRSVCRPNYKHIGTHVYLYIYISGIKMSTFAFLRTASRNLPIKH